LLLEAGFARTQGLAVAAERYGTLAETRRCAAVIEKLTRHPDLAALVQTRRWASAGELERMRAKVLACGEWPDAFAEIMYCAALGWVHG
jgi:hypothetical protein